MHPGNKGSESGAATSLKQRYGLWPLHSRRGWHAPLLTSRQGRHMHAISLASWTVSPLYEATWTFHTAFGVIFQECNLTMPFTYSAFFNEFPLPSIKGKFFSTYTKPFRIGPLQTVYFSTPFFSLLAHTHQLLPHWTTSRPSKGSCLPFPLGLCTACASCLDCLCRTGSTVGLKAWWPDSESTGYLTLVLVRRMEFRNVHNQAMLKSLNQVWFRYASVYYVCTAAKVLWDGHVLGLGERSLARMLCRLCARCSSLASRYRYVFTCAKESRYTGS